MSDRIRIAIALCVILMTSCDQTRKTSEVNGSITNLNAAGLLQDAWEIKPYSFIFSDGISEDPGLFTAGIKGLVLYSSFNRAVHDSFYSSEPPSLQFQDLSPLSKLAGIPVFVNRPDSLGLVIRSNEAFLHYNPEWINWATNNLIPSPEDQIGDRTAQEWYDRSFKRFFRLLVESYQLLETEDLWEFEKRQYYESLKSKDFDALVYFDQRFADALLAYQYPYSHEVMTGPMALSFWLRREMDGSRAVLWKGLTTFMTQFDPSWLQDHSSR